MKIRNFASLLVLFFSFSLSAEANKPDCLDLDYDSKYLGSMSEIPELNIEKKPIEVNIPPKKITKKALKTIRKFLKKKENKPGDGEIILFRGQGELTENMLSASLRSGEVNCEEINAITSESISKNKNLASRYREEQKELWPEGSLYKEYSNIIEFLEGLSPIENLLNAHSSSMGNPHLISTSRELSIAYGNFFRHPDINYVYILKAPVDKVFNIHAFVLEKADIFNRSASSTNAREKEIVIPFDATDYVIGVFDIDKNRMVELD